MTPRTTNTPRRSSVAAMNTAIKWGATFPEQFETDEDSFKFVSRCLLLGVAQVLKMRRLLPPEDFRKRNVTEICQCTTFHSETATGRRCSKKLNGAAEAIKLSYLKEFIIVVSTNETNHDDAIEVFTWSFAYNRGQAVVTLSKPDGEALTTLKYNGPETVKEETIAMLLKIRRLCSRILGPLPDTAFATFRVTYYQNKPSGYQAPGFHLSETVYDLDSRAKRLGLGGTAVAGSKLFVSVQSVCLEDPDEATRQLDRANMTSLTLDDSRIEYAFAYDMGAPVAPSSIRAADLGVLTSKPDVSFASPNLKGHMRALSLQKSPGNCTRLDQMSPEK